MVGERTGRVFRLGDKLRVKVVRVNLDERKIDFELAGEETSNDHSGSKRPPGKFTRKAVGKGREQDSKKGPKSKKKRGAGARSGGKDSGPGSKRRRNAPKSAGQSKKAPGAARKKKPKS